MGKLRSGWSFGKEHGFSGSAGVCHVSGYARGGSVKGGGHGTTPRGPMKHVKQKGPEKGSAPTSKRPPVPSKRPSTGGEHKFAHGGKVKGGPTHVHPVPKGEMLAYKKGGLRAEKEDRLPNEHQAGFKPEDYEEHEKETGFTHDDPEVGDHYEAARGGLIGHKKARGGHIKAPQHGPVRSKAHMSHKDHTEATVEHSHFLSSHKLASHKGLKHDKHGHDDHAHHAPPHGTHGFKKYAAGGPTRPPGMPRAPMLGMKRMRHGPGERQMPGIPGMAPVATGSLGMGQGTAPRVMKKGGKT